VAIRVRGKVKINLGSKTEKKVDIFLIPVLKVLRVQKAISYHPIVSSGTDSGVTIDYRCDGFHINVGKVCDEVFFLLCQLIEIPGKSRRRDLKIHHNVLLLFNTGVQY